MARENSESNYTDCKGSRCTVEQVEKIRKIKMEGKRRQRPKRNAYGNVSAENYEGLTKKLKRARSARALKRITALKRTKVEARAPRAARTRARDHDPNT